MASLYNLTADYMEVLDMAQDPDIEPQVIADTLEGIDGEIELKAENTTIIMKELEAEVSKLKAEEQRLYNRRKSIENNIEDMKKQIYNAMKLTGKTKFKTTLFNFSIAKNGGKIPVIVDADCSEMPDDFVIISKKPNVEALREYIEKHGTCAYAHYGERGEGLRIR